jgi:hypothetical protein
MILKERQHLFATTEEIRGAINNVQKTRGNVIESFLFFFFITIPEAISSGASKVASFFASIGEAISSGAGKVKDRFTTPPLNMPPTGKGAKYQFPSGQGKLTKANTETSQTDEQGEQGTSTPKSIDTTRR